MTLRNETRMGWSLREMNLRMVEVVWPTIGKLGREATKPNLTFVPLKDCPYP